MTKKKSLSFAVGFVAASLGLALIPYHILTYQFGALSLIVVLTICLFLFFLLGVLSSFLSLGILLIKWHKNPLFARQALETPIAYLVWDEVIEEMRKSAQHSD